MQELAWFYLKWLLKKKIVKMVEAPDFFRDIWFKDGNCVLLDTFGY
jgi:hypothetical protein